MDKVHSLLIEEGVLSFEKEGNFKIITPCGLELGPFKGFNCLFFCKKEDAEKFKDYCFEKEYEIIISP